LQWGQGLILVSCFPEGHGNFLTSKAAAVPDSCVM
jgi:hypothetical protein